MTSVERLLVGLLVLSESCIVSDHRLELLGHLVDLNEKPGSLDLPVTRVEGVENGLVDAGVGRRAESKANGLQEHVLESLIADMPGGALFRACVFVAAPPSCSMTGSRPNWFFNKS